MNGLSVDFLICRLLHFENFSYGISSPHDSDFRAEPLGQLQAAGLAPRAELPPATSAPTLSAPSSSAPLPRENLFCVLLLLSSPLLGVLISRLYCITRRPFKFFTPPSEDSFGVPEADLSTDMSVSVLHWTRVVLSILEDYFPLLVHLLFMLPLVVSKLAVFSSGLLYSLYFVAFCTFVFFSCVLLAEFLLCIAIDALSARQLFRISLQVNGTMRTMMAVIRRFRHIDQLFYSWTFYFISTLGVLVLSYNRVALNFPFADEELLRFYEDCLKKLVRSTANTSDGPRRSSPDVHTMSPPLWKSLAAAGNLSDPSQVYDYRNVSGNSSDLMQLIFGMRRGEMQKQMLNRTEVPESEAAGAMLSQLGSFNLSAFAVLASIAACCSSPMSLLGFCIALSRLSCALLQGVHCFVYWRPPGAARRLMHAQLELNLANEGLSEGILMFILALNSNLIELELAERFQLLPIIMFVLSGSFLHSVLEIVADALQRLPATSNRDLLAHLRPLGIALLLVVLPPVLILKLVAAFGYELDFWILIIGASCIFVTIEALQAMLTYALLTYDVLVRPLAYLDEWLLGIRCVTGVLDLFITIASICFCLVDMATSGWSFVSILILVVHFYSNVWLRVQSAWKALKRRRDASKIIAALAPVTEAELLALHDICAICQHDLCSPSDMGDPSPSSPASDHSSSAGASHIRAPDADSRDDLALHGDEIGADWPHPTISGASTTASSSSPSSEPVRAPESSPVVPHVKRTACKHHFHVSMPRVPIPLFNRCPAIVSYYRCLNSVLVLCNIIV